MDVLLRRDGDLLWLIFKVLNVIVDVEDVIAELGKIMELEKKEGKCFDPAVVPKNSHLEDE